MTLVISDSAFLSQNKSISTYVVKQRWLMLFLSCLAESEWALTKFNNSWLFSPFMVYLMPPPPRSFPCSSLVASSQTETIPLHLRLGSLIYSFPYIVTLLGAEATLFTFPSLLLSSIQPLGLSLYYVRKWMNEKKEVIFQHIYWLHTVGYTAF